MIVKKIIIMDELKQNKTEAEKSKSLYKSIKQTLEKNEKLELDFKGAPTNVITVLNDSVRAVLLEEKDIDTRNKIVGKITFSHVKDQGLLNNIVEMIENVLEE